MTNDDGMDSLRRDVDACDRAQAREFAETMIASAVVLVERFGWSRMQLVAALDYELRERQQDGAEDDVAFREWYVKWRKENPDAA